MVAVGAMRSVRRIGQKVYFHLGGGPLRCLAGVFRQRSCPLKPRWPTVAGGAAVLFTTLLWRLGEPSFWDPDEAHYAETTRELLLSGDWLAPMYNGAPFFDKPIVFH